jgi:glycosyltransferase involved in cell wall biosynthesis
MKEVKVRVLIDLTNLSAANHGGVPTFAKGIVKGFLEAENTEVSILQKSDFKFLENYTVDKILVANKFTNIISRRFLLLFVFLNQKKLYAWFKNLEIKGVIKVDSFDYIYTPTTYLNYRIDHTPTLVSLHDIQEKDFPENFSFFERIYRNFFVSFTLQNSTKIHVSSNFVKDSLLKHYSYLKKKVEYSVVGEGVDLKYFENVLPKERIFLFPARSWKHKNHQVFFNALKDLIEIHDFRFIITGASVSDFDNLGIQVPKQVQVAGLLDLPDLKDIYTKAYCVISCSFYESSSLPLLEGVASGCRIIASNIPAHLEMASDFRFSLFNPESPKELLEVIKNMISDYKTENWKSETVRNIESLRSRDWSLIAKALLVSLES